MTSDPNEEQRALIKKTLQACGGSVKDAAACLGIDRRRLSHLLNHRGLVEWYVPYRNKLTMERMRARWRRSYDQRRRKKLIDQGIDPSTVTLPGYKPRYV